MTKRYCITEYLTWETTQEAQERARKIAGIAKEAMTNSKQKGARGEREAAKYLRESWGIEDAKRGCQHAGGFDSPDIKHGLTGYHIEVKYAGRCNIYDSIEQAAADASEDIPLVLYRQVRKDKHNKKDWVVILYADDFKKVLDVAKT